MLWGVVLTVADVLLVLLLQRRGFRLIEAVVIGLIVVIGACFAFEIAVSDPDIGAIVRGLVPSPAIVTHADMLYIAIGILGATVMPHNLYLHSAVVQTRRYALDSAGKREAIRYATIDSTVALLLAFFVNGAILVVAAATFHANGRDVAEIQDAYRMLAPLLGLPIASTLFAVALLASGQNSSLTGTMAGQIVMEGFLDLRMAPWSRRLVTRLVAVVPAIVVTAFHGSAGVTSLLVLSQVILSLQLPFAVIPLIQFTSDRRKMGEFASGMAVRALGWTAAVVILALNLKLLYDTAIG